jgi:aspartate aminotransferase
MDINTTNQQTNKHTRISEAANRLEGQAAFIVLQRARELERQGRSILHFEIGEPDFDTPDHIVEGAKRAIDDKQTHYVSSSGIPELRESVCSEVERTRGFRPDPEQVLITPGGNAIIYFTLACLTDPGDAIMTPDPGFFSYWSSISYLDRKLIPLPILEENEFRMNPDDVRERITPETKLIIMNSPQNPTGSVMTRSEIEEMADIAEEHDVYLLTDEMYSKMTYDTPHHSPSGRDQCLDRTILLDGFSKKYAMTGWRLGWAVAPHLVTEKMGLLLQTIVGCTNSFIQHAGVSALQGGDQCINGMMEQFRKRRDVLVKGLNKINGISCVVPQGAFYAFPNITGTGMTSTEFTNYLLEKGGISILSGSDFGQHGEGYIRFCYASDIENIKKALEIMEGLF